MQPDPTVAAEYRVAGWWGDTTVGDAVAGWARGHPTADALVADGRRATWADYDARATAQAVPFVSAACLGLRVTP